MNPFFNWLKDSGTQAMLILLGTVAACIAAIAAIYYGKKSLSKKDLATIEEHTAESTHHLRRHTQRDELATRIERVPLEVWGQDPVNQNLHVYIRCPEPDALPTRVGLHNEHGTLFGASAVVRSPDGNYSAEVDADAATRWFQGGTPVVVGPRHTRVVLRINLAIDGHEGYREIAASLRQTQLESDRGRTMSYVLEGAI